MEAHYQKPVLFDLSGRKARGQVCSHGSKQIFQCTTKKAFGLTARTHLCYQLSHPPATLSQQKYRLCWRAFGNTDRSLLAGGISHPTEQMVSVLAGTYAACQEYVFSHSIFIFRELFIIFIFRRFLAKLSN